MPKNSALLRLRRGYMAINVLDQLHAYKMAVVVVNTTKKPKINYPNQITGRLLDEQLRISELQFRLPCNRKYYILPCIYFLFDILRKAFLLLIWACPNLKLSWHFVIVMQW